MGTITSRRRKDGSIGYTAQIRIMRDGAKLYQESQTFDRQWAAKAWATKREAELVAPGAIERASRDGVTIKEIIEQCLEEYERIRPLGKTKRQALKVISETWIGEINDTTITRHETSLNAHGICANR